MASKLTNQGGPHAAKEEQVKLRDAINRVFREETVYDWDGFAQSLTKFDIFAFVVIGGVVLYFIVRIAGSI